MRVTSRWLQARVFLDGTQNNGTGVFSTADVYIDKSGVLFLTLAMPDCSNNNVAGNAQIRGYARISSDTWSLGNGGNVNFKANSLLIDSMGNPSGAGIASEAALVSSGNGG